MVEVVEREYDGIVLRRHWIEDGAKRHYRARREDLVKIRVFKRSHHVYKSRL
jgi:hypothetical protein